MSKTRMIPYSQLSPIEKDVFTIAMIITVCIVIFEKCFKNKNTEIDQYMELDME